MLFRSDAASAVLHHLPLRLPLVAAAYEGANTSVVQGVRGVALGLRIDHSRHISRTRNTVIAFGQFNNFDYKKRLLELDPF